ncbi:MAG: SMC-Scp complex subunit ScpB [Planctomycetia bacterium]|nr:SMC-Scp complex subunit ScpB [Planctomycetia bacterium]
MPENTSHPVSTSEPDGPLAWPPDDRGLSLEALTAGFAEMLAGGQDPYAPVADPVAAFGPGAAAGAERTAELPGPDVTPRTILEAMLFVGHPQNEPLLPERVAGLMRGVRPAEIDELVRELNARYRADNCPYEIHADGAGYRLVLREEYAALRDRVAGRRREARLSRAAIEVLALVAYNESITSDEISRIRGRPSGGLLAQLVRRRLLKIERVEGRPRQAHYSTTERFLELFGLASLADLPRSEQVEQK